MKKVSMLLVFAFSLFLFSCDGTSSNDGSGILADSDSSGETTVDPATPTVDPETPIVLTDEQNRVNAAATLAIVGDGLQGIDWEKLFTNAKDNIPQKSAKRAIDWDSLFNTDGLNTSIPLGTVYDQDGMNIDASLLFSLTNGIGIGLTFDLDNYELQTDEDPLPTVSGQIIVGMSMEAGIESIFTQMPVAINVTMYTPLDDQLVFTGGTLDGQKIGLVDVKMKFSMSEFNIGSPVEISGMAIINGVTIPFDSKILELLIGMM